MVIKVWLIDTYDRDLTRTGRVDVWTKLDMTVRHNRGGVWSLTIPANHPQSHLLVEGSRIVATSGDVTVSGPVRGLAAAYSGGVETVTVTGVDDMSVVSQRLTYPDPTSEAWAQTVAYWQRTGPAETVITDALDLNLGAAALPARTVPIILPTPSGLGATVTANARFSNLADDCYAWATSGQIGYRIVQTNGTRQLTFYTPHDLTGEIVLSEQVGNLRAWSWAKRSPAVTRALVAGQGEGAARIIRERAATNPEQDWDTRTETFIDARDTTDNVLLDQRGDEALAEGAATAGLSITPVDTPGKVFGTDYWLGDRISVEVSGARYDDIVSEVRVEVDGSGEKRTPTVGDAGVSGETSALYTRVKDLTRRISQLERRQ